MPPRPQRSTLIFRSGRALDSPIAANKPAGPPPTTATSTIMGTAYGKPAPCRSEMGSRYHSGSISGVRGNATQATSTDSRSGIHFDVLVDPNLFIRSAVPVSTSLAAGRGCPIKSTKIATALQCTLQQHYGFRHRAADEGSKAQRLDKSKKMFAAILRLLRHRCTV